LSRDKGEGKTRRFSSLKQRPGGERKQAGPDLCKKGMGELAIQERGQEKKKTLSVSIVHSKELSGPYLKRGKAERLGRKAK